MGGGCAHVRLAARRGPQLLLGLGGRGLLTLPLERYPGPVPLHLFEDEAHDGRVLGFEPGRGARVVDLSVRAE